MNYRDKAKEIGNRIKTCRKEYQKNNEKVNNQQDFAEMLHYSDRKIIGKWENGHELPSLDDLLNMCELFDCELGYLLCEYDTKTRAAADIQKETGLSEAAINVLQNEKKFIDDRISRFFWNDPERAYSIKSDLRIINAFITDGEPIFSAFDAIKSETVFEKEFKQSSGRWGIFRQKELELFNQIYDDTNTAGFEKYEWFMEDGYKLFNIPEEDIMNNGMDEFEYRQLLHYDYEHFVNQRQHNMENQYRNSMTLTFNQIIDSLLNDERKEL